jgi:hypothetical protein
LLIRQDQFLVVDDYLLIGKNFGIRHRTSIR